MLLKEEQYVVKWLSQYGALPKTQLTKMLQKPSQTAERIIKNLKKQMRAACGRRVLCGTGFPMQTGSAYHTGGVGAVKVH